MTPLNSPDPSDTGAKRNLPIQWAPEFEEAMKFSMNDGQREAHIQKMHAEAAQITANARKTNAEAKKLENSNFWEKLRIVGIYCAIAIFLIFIGFICGAVTQKITNFIS